MKRDISPFLTIMDPDEIYSTEDKNNLLLTHAVWLSNHWDDMINIQLNNISEYEEKGIFIASSANASADILDYKLEWLPLKSIKTIEDLHIRETLLKYLSRVNALKSFIIYFKDKVGIDMAYFISIPI
jgi:hypothetical protein